MKRGVDDAGLYPLGDERAHNGFPGATGDADPAAVVDPAYIGIVRMDLQAVLAVPHDIRRAAGLGADIVLGQYAAGRQQQREAAAGALRRGDVLGNKELAPAAHEPIDVHRWRTS